jgi:hypothetical protein
MIVWGTVITLGMVAVGLLVWRLLQGQGDATRPTDDE